MHGWEVTVVMSALASAVTRRSPARSQVRATGQEIGIRKLGADGKIGSDQYFAPGRYDKEIPVSEILI